MINSTGATKYVSYFNYFKQILIMAYLADNFNSLNSLNMSFQGTKNNILCAENNIEAMLNKLRKRSFKKFPSLSKPF